MAFPPPSPRQARFLWFSLTSLTLVLIVGMVVTAFGWLINRLSAVLLPVALALILAYILDPVIEFLARRKVPRVWAIILVFLMGIVVGAGLIGSVVPDLVKESRKLVEVLDAREFHLRIQDLLKKTPFFKELTTAYEPLNIPAQSPNDHSQNPARTHKDTTNLVAAPATNGVEVSIQVRAPATTNADGTISTNNVELSADTQQLQRMLNAPFSETIVPALAKALVSFVNWIPRQLGAVTTWVEFLVGFVLVPVYVFYFLLEKHGINKHWTDYLPITESRAKQELVFVLRAINECMVVFFRGQVLVALCVGTLLTIGYMLLGLNYYVLLGTVAAVLGVIPYLGTITSLAIALTVAAVQFSDWVHPLS